MDGSMRGRLLVAAPHLADPNFFRTVVLICAHDDDGAFGVVLNRASDAPIAEYLPDWVPLAAEPDVVFFGGPVQPETAVGIGEAKGVLRGHEAWTPVTGPVGMIDLSVTPDLLDVARMRVFSGYSGWGAGQLEGELSRGDWIVLDSAPGDAFVAEPDDLWRRVLRRQPGRLAMLATFPVDPSLN